MGILLTLGGILATVIWGWGRGALQLRIGDREALIVCICATSVLPIAALLVCFPRPVKAVARLFLLLGREVGFIVKGVSRLGRLDGLIAGAEHLHKQSTHDTGRLDNLAEDVAKLERRLCEGISQLGGHAAQIEQKLGDLTKLVGNVRTIGGEIESLRETIHTGSPHIRLLARLRDDETCASALREIDKIVRNPYDERFADQELARVVSETAEGYLIDSERLDVGLLAREVRRAVYELGDNGFAQTKASLRSSAQQMLGCEDGPVTRLNVRAFEEITRYADRWPPNELHSAAGRLRQVRKSQAFVDAMRDKSIPIMPTFASAGKPECLVARVWKRVWAREHGEEGGSRGTIKCFLANGNGCKGGVLEEVSLCGASCLACELKAPGRIWKCELELPDSDTPIEVSSAEFRPHGASYFAASTGERVSPGFAIEFRDMDFASFGRLANFVRARPELNPQKPPPAN